MRKTAISSTLLVWLLGATLTSAQTPDNVVWIDVRTPAEFADGHLADAQLIPFDSIAVGVTKLELAKDRPIYLYCAAGGRAEKARQTLLQLGYTDVTNAGGLDSARALAGAEP